MAKARYQDEINIEDIYGGLNDYFGLARCDIESCVIQQEHCSSNPKTQIVITLKDQDRHCPHCHSDQVNIHGCSYRTINYSQYAGRQVDIILKLRRYRCKECRKTFMQYNPFSIKRGRISVETIVNILKTLQDCSVTFTDVARRFHVSVTTVIHIFDTHVKMERLPLPEYLCMDENYAFRTDKSKYVCVLLDFQSQDVVDVLPNRHKKDLINYFKDIPRKERNKVKAVGIDMYPNYREVVHECFPPSTKVVVDRFHLVKEFNNRTDQIRKARSRQASDRIHELEKKIEALESRPDYQSAAIKEEERKLTYELGLCKKRKHLLKKFSWVLYKNPDSGLFDENREKKHNKTMDQYLNFADIRRLLLESDPSLAEAGRIREGLTDFFKCKSYEEGEPVFDQLYEEMNNSFVPEIKSFASTFRTWKREILYSLDIIDTIYEIQKDGSVGSRDRHLHNGIIERINKQIKILKHTACGYTNFKRFRQRVLYTLRKAPSFSIDEAYEENTIRKKPKKDKDKEENT